MFTWSFTDLVFCVFRLLFTWSVMNFKKKTLDIQLQLDNGRSVSETSCYSKINAFKIQSSASGLENHRTCRLARTELGMLGTLYWCVPVVLCIHVIVYLTFCLLECWSVSGGVCN